MMTRKQRRWLPGALVTVATLFVAAAFAGGLAETNAQGGPTLTAASATITVDGDNSDWAGITALPVTLEQFTIPDGTDWEFNGTVDPKNARLKVATDANNIYVLFEVDDTYDYVADNAKLSAAAAIMFRMDAAAGPHMGADDPDYTASQGMVDIWHWELECGPGVLSGIGDPGSGNDPDCNLDDEYATDPESRNDDDQAGAENSITGAWSHTAAAVGQDGTWIFEFSRPLSTGDSTDAQFAPGGTAKVALAYWDPSESVIGWSDAGHLVSSEEGWITVSLPGEAPAAGGSPAAPSTGTGLAITETSSGTGSTFIWLAGIGVLLLAGGATLAAYSVRRRA